MGRTVVIKKLKKPIKTVPGITRRKTDEAFHQKMLEQQKKIDKEEAERKNKQKAQNNEKEGIMKKKRYICFGYDDCYPSGGMGDARFTFNTEKELVNESDRFYYEHYNIFDTETFNVGYGYNAIRAFEDLKNNKS